MGVYYIIRLLDRGRLRGLVWGFGLYQVFMRAMSLVGFDISPIVLILKVC